MLEQKDIEILKAMMTEVVGQSEANISQKMDERIAKLENDNTSILLKMCSDMQKDIAELKSQTA